MQNPPSLPFNSVRYRSRHRASFYFLQFSVRFRTSTQTTRLAIFFIFCTAIYRHVFFFLCWPISACRRTRRTWSASPSPRAWLPWLRPAGGSWRRRTLCAGLPRPPPPQRRPLQRQLRLLRLRQRRRRLRRRPARLSRGQLRLLKTVARWVVFYGGVFRGASGKLFVGLRGCASCFWGALFLFRMAFQPFLA